MTPRTLRIVCTNDFLGSLAPMRTSYGALPGGRALQRTVDELRRGQPTLWADAGDFSHGGPLSTATGGVAGFDAAAELGFDVATVGNHELDWGLAHFDEHRERLPFPLICANVDIGLDPATLVATDAGPVGFVGLTHPSLNAFTPHAPKPDPGHVTIVAEHAAKLRAQGAVAVVVLIHFGVDWSVAADGTHVPDPTPVLELCGPFSKHVDGVVLGHTLGRWADVVDGVPYAQPWAFGAEVGVIDLDLEGGGHAVELRPVDGEPAAWHGAGRAAIAAAEAMVVGEIHEPLAIDFADDLSLADFVAEALLVLAGATGAVVPVVGMHQPAIEGAMYHWPAGPVTEADLARLWPWTDDRAFVGELSPEELETIVSFRAPEPWLAWGTGVAPEEPGSAPTLVIPRDYVDWAAVQIVDLIGREIEWRPVNVRVRDAIRDALAAVRREAARVATA